MKITRDQYYSFNNLLLYWYTEMENGNKNAIKIYNKIVSFLNTMNIPLEENTEVSGCKKLKPSVIVE